MIFDRFSESLEGRDVDFGYGLSYIWAHTDSPARGLRNGKSYTGEKLRKAVEEATFIKGGDPACAEGIKYDFRMSSRVLKWKYGRSIDINKLPEAEKAEMVIEPGEVVFVLTEETLELPIDIMAQLVPKRKLSHEGVLVLGGFCIDPLYSGKLLVGLYNFASSRFVLEPERKLIAAVFYQLEETERGAFDKPEASVVDFPGELVRLISSYQPIDLRGLRDGLSGLESQISNLRTEITTDKEWKKDFQTKLELQATNIDKLFKRIGRRKGKSTGRREASHRRTWPDQGNASEEWHAK